MENDAVSVFSIANTAFEVMTPKNAQIVGIIIVEIILNIFLVCMTCILRPFLSFKPSGSHTSK
ncbi:hypothetical protein IKG68_01580 [Candidatus Saccharibacteria bacterium]|nr:hypothetical protein [Candidatus Saccharibacteria bacterium]